MVLHFFSPYSFAPFIVIDKSSFLSKALFFESEFCPESYFPMTAGLNSGKFPCYEKKSITGVSALPLGYVLIKVKVEWGGVGLPTGI